MLSRSELLPLVGAAKQTRRRERMNAILSHVAKLHSRHNYARIELVVKRWAHLISGAGKARRLSPKA